MSEPKEVESASVGAISDHEKGQKEEFYKFQQHLEKTQEEISKWPSWMREAGRASMGLGQREPKEVGAGGLGTRVLDYIKAPGGEGPYAAEWEDKPHRLLWDVIDEWQASLLREKELLDKIARLEGSVK